jgi:MFS family permease
MTSEKNGSAGVDDSVALAPTDKFPSNQETDTTRVSDDEEYIEPRMTKAKWLACIALGISYTTAFQQGATLGAIIKSIDIALGLSEDISHLDILTNSLGPTSYYNWMLSASTVSTSIALPLSGGFSDVFGRRWFVILGCVIGIISAIIAICANSDAVIIVAAIIGGLQAGSQQLALVSVNPYLYHRNS